MKKQELESVVPMSTYRACYLGEKTTLPLVMYKDILCYYLPGASEPTRKQCQSENVPRYMLKARPKPPAYPSPIVAHSKPQRPAKRYEFEGRPNHVFDTKFGPMSVDMVNDMYRETRYRTCSQKANAEYGLPMYRPEPSVTTKELRPDMVRLRSQKYDERPEEWQDAVLWDRVQNRTWSPRTTLPTDGEKLHLSRQKQTTSGDSKDKEIMRLVKTDGLANVFVKKCPSYAGYAPLCPPDTKLDDKKCPREMTSTMKASYRTIPVDILTSSNRRKGTLSKTVTLTLPFNPFNKVGQEDVGQEDVGQALEGRYAGGIDTVYWPSTTITC